MIVEPKKPALEIHLSETVVENPTVPLRWCFDKEMHDRITDGLKQGFGYGVLLVAQLDGDADGFREVRDVKDPLGAFTFVTFPRPGNWSLGLFLFERTSIAEGKDISKTLMRSLVSRYKQKDSYGDYEQRISNLSEIDLSKPERSLFVYLGSLITARIVSVEVLKEIFAPEPSETVTAFANYFFKKSPFDECALRRRLWLVMGLLCGFVPYILIEVTKRVGILISGVISVSLFLKGSLKTITYAFKPRVKLPFVTQLEQDEKGNLISLWKGWWFCLTPGMLVVLSTISWVFFKVAILLWNVFPIIWDFIMSHPKTDILIGLAVTAFVLWGMMPAIKRWNDRHQNSAVYRNKQSRKREMEEAADRARAVQLGRLKATLAERRARALVCGEAPATVSLTALPPEMKTFGLSFMAFKRKVCRPFS